VILDNPDLRGRKEILKVHSNGKPLDEDVDLERVARQTVGFSGADLANLVNEAAILAARRTKKIIALSEFTEAIDRVLLGPARKSRIINDQEKEITAYHEAGHALVAHVLPNADNPFKVTIVSRGQSGGHTRYLPEEDRNLWTRGQFSDMLAAALGGRVAEELVFNQLTTGAGSDIEQATNIARQMVTRFGMSEKLGPRTFGKREEMVFLGREISEQRDYSDKVAETIDAEVHDIIDSSYDMATEVIKEHMPKLEQLAKYLVENETIEVDELNALWETPPDASDESPDSPGSPEDDRGPQPDVPPIAPAPPAPAPAGD
jgi:cell division protease FtsH